MARRRRGFATFSLSFIDCMSCGLGAVILLFMIINHASQQQASHDKRAAAAGLGRLEARVLDKRQAVAALAADLEKSKKSTAAAAARVAELQQQLRKKGGGPENAAKKQKSIAQLARQLKRVDARVAQLEKQKRAGAATRSHAGRGDRQYLTGLKVGGDHILILLDASASMLDDTIVNIIRRRNMGAARRRAAPKWRRAVATVDWITTQVPPDAKFQIYAFNQKVTPALSGSAGHWQATGGGARLSAALAAVKKMVPAGGTSLVNALAAAGRLTPAPDNIYLITDSLPTQGSKARGGIVSAQKRLRYYRAALDQLPRGAPVNVILMPMQGDPVAASAFWQLAQATDGAFLAPARDWP